MRLIWRILSTVSEREVVTTGLWDISLPLSLAQQKRDRLSLTLSSGHGKGHDAAQPLPSLLVSHHQEHGFIPQLQIDPASLQKPGHGRQLEMDWETAVDETSWKGMGK